MRRSTGWALGVHGDARTALTPGPQRVTDEEPPAGWTPLPPVGFAPPVTPEAPDVDPVVWEGDYA